MLASTTQAKPGELFTLKALCSTGQSLCGCVCSDCKMPRAEKPKAGCRGKGAGGTANAEKEGEKEDK